MATISRSFTSESVCAGHPDKICDQISDAIVDAVLHEDPYGRVAIETLVTTNKVILAGEVTSRAVIDYARVARDQIERLGYTDDKYGFSHKALIDVYIHEQSSEIAVGVDDAGAGDQGMMFGYACRETNNFMPMPIAIAHALTARIDEVREEKLLPYLRPDGKAQVTVGYDNDVPVEIVSVVLAVPHEESEELEKVKDDLYRQVVLPVLSGFELSYPQFHLIVNGTGVWHIGGPASDTGVTGRKIVVDTYGGYARVGGGAFSGKDPTKVDRSGAYAARYLAKNLVAHRFADKAEVSLAYFIGAKKPVMQEVETFGTAKKSDQEIKAFVSELLDTSVQGILEGLQLRKPLYLATATYGHFGRKGFPWEEIVQK